MAMISHKSFLLTVLALALLGCFVTSVLSLRCSRYEPNPKLNEYAYPRNSHYNSRRDYFGAPAICDPFLDGEAFFVLDSNGTTKESTEQQAFAKALGFGTLSHDCRMAATRYLCAFAFRPCNTFAISPSLPNFFVFPLPSPPCQSLCEDFVNECTGQVDDSSLPNCSERDDTDQLVYPKKNYIFYQNGGKYNVQCQNFSTIPRSQQEKSEPVVCPFPLVVRPNGEPPCQPNCPNVGLYTDDEWDNVKKEKLGMSIVSLAFDIFTFITLITIKERRLFPANIGSVITLIHAVWMFIFVIAAARGDDTTCKNEWEFSTCWNDYLCGVEGMTIYFCALTICFLWTALAIHLFILVVMEISPKRVRKYSIHTFVACFIVPVIGAIIIYATSNFYGAPAYPWCFVREKAYNYPLFWGWILGLIIITFLVTIAVVGKMIMVKKNMSSRSSLAKNLHILIFITLFLFVYVFNISIVFYNEVNEARFQEAVPNFVRCNVYESNGKNNCPYPTDRVPIATMYVYVWTIAGSGMFLLVSYGLSSSYIKHWQRLLKNIFTCRFTEIPNMAIADTTGGSSTVSSTRRD